MVKNAKPLSTLFKDIRGEIANDRGAKISGLVLMVFSVAAVFLEDANFTAAAPFFVIGIYLAFRKTTKKNESSGN